jgi:zinc/manganese transport system substrate-binding protein
MIAMRDADVFIHSGLDLELWVPQLLRGSRNRKIQPGQPGNVNAARGIRLKEVPQEISRSQGDLHVYGNPHYVLDPINVILVARTVRDALKNADPDHAEAYAARYQQFEDRMKKKLLEWLTKLRPYQGSKVVGYHNVFPYFADRFGLKVIGFVEPKPGIEPSPRHIADLVEQMRQEKCKVLLLNTWADRTTARAVAERVDAKTVSFPEWVGGVDGTDDCIALFDYLVDNLVKAFERTSANPVAGGARRRNGTDGGTSR